jgi:cbb3-type cytochrome oxidase subunit 3
MEILRTLMTLAAFTAFLAIVWWAYAPSRRELWRNRGELSDD